MLSLPLSPSRLFAVTVYVCSPRVAVSSVPELPDPPLESEHDSRPGPNVLSAHENVVGMTAFLTYTPPPAGESIVAAGGDATLNCEPDKLPFLTFFGFLPSMAPHTPVN